MNTALQSRSRLATVAGLVSTTLAAILAAYLIAGSGDPDSTSAAGYTATGTVSDASGDHADLTQIQLRVGDKVATATLENTPAAEEFAAMLPMRLSLHDPMGQAKSGRLPYRIQRLGADPVLDPELATIYYWPPSGDIAIIYDDLSQFVPTPGLVRLGSVDTGLDAIATAGNRFTVWIDHI